jgi:hypothetical protein
MVYSAGAVERAMKVQEVVLRALSRQLTWLQAADILGRSPCSMRRLRLWYERYGYDGLLDRRRQTPSPKRAPVAEVERVRRLYRERYPTSTCATSCASRAGSITSPSGIPS